MFRASQRLLGGDPGSNASRLGRLLVHRSPALVATTRGNPIWIASAKFATTSTLDRKTNTEYNRSKLKICSRLLTWTAAAVAT